MTTHPPARIYQFVEPHQSGGHCVVVMTEKQAIAWTKFNRKASTGSEYASDKEALEDFKSIHWASEVESQTIADKAIEADGKLAIPMTPSDPAKHAEAVELLKQLDALLDFHEPWGDGEFFKDATQINAVQKAAVAFLDSLPGDDNEPATVEWLEGIGWERSTPKGLWLDSPRGNVRFDVDSQAIVSGEWDEVLIPSPTRAAVRHLLAALTPLTPATGGE